jgi:glycine cleavage system aminomethyltransferase T
VAAVWIEAPGLQNTRRMTAPLRSTHAADIARYPPVTWEHSVARVNEAFNKFWIVHRSAQFRPTAGALPPMYEREMALGAAFFEVAGWECPMWYEANAPLVEAYGDRIAHRPAEWDSRWWSPITLAEHLAMRERAALVDLTPIAILDITGPGALAYLERLCVNRIASPIGRTVYTPLLDEAGGIVADLTVLHVGPDRYRVVTGGGLGMRDKQWFTERLPADGSAQLADVTSAYSAVGVGRRDIVGW